MAAVESSCQQRYAPGEEGQVPETCQLLLTPVRYQESLLQQWFCHKMLHREDVCHYNYYREFPVLVN